MDYWAINYGLVSEILNGYDHAYIMYMYILQHYKGMFQLIDITYITLNVRGLHDSCKRTKVFGWLKEQGVTLYFCKKIL